MELIDALIDDTETHCIVTYIEGTSDGRALLDVGRRALAAGKPILMWKGGVTEQGARAAASHTASMTGSYDFYRALFKQTGIVEVQELHEAVDYLKALLPRKLPQGRNVSIMGVSGGSAIVFADAGERAGLGLSELDERTQQRLATVVPSIGAIHNPIDLTAGYFSKANQEKLETAVRAVLDDAGTHAVCVNLATTGRAGGLVAAEVLSRVARTTDKPIVVFASAPASEIGDVLRAFADGGVPVFPSPSRAARAVAMLSGLREARTRQSHYAASHGDQTARGSGAPWKLLADATGPLPETQSKAILAEIGVRVSRDVIVQDAAQAESVASDMTAPFVVKIVSPDIPHKTEIGGVKVGLRNAQEVAQAAAEVLRNAGAQAPAARIEGVMVSEMVRGGFELIAGVTHDEVFGPVVLVGAGGIHAEVLRDTSCRLAPFDEATAREMIDELRCRPILDGVRGSPALDVAAMARLLAALSTFAWQARDLVQEVDVNPVFVLPEGAVAADALIIPRQASGSPAWEGH